jgi:Subtilase family
MSIRRTTCGAVGLLVAAGTLTTLSSARADVLAPNDAVVSARPGVLNLKSFDFITNARASLIAADRAFAPGSRAVLMFDGPMTDERRTALSASGITLGEYIPADSFIVTFTQPVNSRQIRALGFVTWAGEYQNSWKINPAIGAIEFETPERREWAERGLLALNAVLFAGADIRAGIDQVASIPGVQIIDTVTSGGDAAIRLIAPADRAAALAELSTVSWIEELPEFAPRNYASRWIVQNNVKSEFPLYANGLRGEGQILGLIDGWVSPTHCSFADPSVPITAPGLYPNHRKIYAYNGDSIGYNKHGTHVAGTAVGDAGADNLETRGVAYLARMAFNIWPDLDEGDMFAKFLLHHQQGAFVHTNSWGQNSVTAYDFAARAVDNFSWTHPDNLVIFAVSNLFIIGNPENAKNCLAVTSTGGEGNQDVICGSTNSTTDKPGKGPTVDGRLKPEIAAPGCGVASAVGQACNTQAQDGTSTAAPAVAGVAVLMRQYYTNGYYPRGTPDPDFAFSPTGAMLKAAIINAGVDVKGDAGYPNEFEGWGRLTADNVLYFPGDSRRTVLRDVRADDPRSLATGQEHSFTIEVAASGEPLRVTMAFHDAPAALMASYAPVNDLDLIVTSPTGETYLGNAFSGGASIKGGDRDPRNNVEQVLINNPAPGLWRVRVLAPAVNVGPRQSYAVVASGDIAEGCPADIDQSGFLDTDDFDLFADLFAQGSLRSDYNASGDLDGDDYDAFIAAFENGCE